MHSCYCSCLFVSLMRTCPDKRRGTKNVFKWGHFTVCFRVGTTVGWGWHEEQKVRLTDQNVITEGLCKNLNSNVVDTGEFSCYLLSVELEAWFISLLEMKLRISEKYESSFSSKSA